jgi:hypothetical protein
MQGSKKVLCMVIININTKNVRRHSLWIVTGGEENEKKKLYTEYSMNEDFLAILCYRGEWRKRGISRFLAGFQNYY